MPFRRLAPLALLAAVLLTPGARGAPPSEWVRIDHPALHGGSYISYVNGVVAPEGGAGWLAGGYVVDPDGVRTPSVWSSSDGASWRRTTLPATTSRERRDGVMHIARRHGVVVALGDRFEGLLRPAAWRGSGGSWVALSDVSSPLLSFSGKFVDLTASTDGFVALGWGPSSTGTVAPIFASRDGRTWVVEATVPVAAGERFVPTGVTAVGGRLFVTGGSVVGGATEGRIFVWDGMEWTTIEPRASGMAGTGENQVASVAYRQGIGFVAGGVARRGDLEIPAAWVSSDGIAWRRLPDNAVPAPAGGGAIHEIVVAGNRFVAAGNSRSGPLLWTSSDGRRWTSVDAPKKRYQAAWGNVHIAATPTTTVLSLSGEGIADAYRRGASGSWSVIDKPPAFPGATGGNAELRGVAASPTRLVAIGQDARGRPLVLASRNARSWARAQFADSQARLLAVAHGRGGFAIAGWRLVEGRARVTLWTSKDGQRWRRLGGTALSPLGAFVDVEPDGNRFSLAAMEGTARGLQVSAWSTDGRTALPSRILGPGDARAICVGPNGATVVAVRGEGARAQIVAWHRARTGPWSLEPEVVATGAEANGCADAPSGTVVAGRGTTDSTAATWRRARPGAPWARTVLAVTSPPSAILAVVRDGDGFLTTGQSGARGQVDLAGWAIGRNSVAALGGPVFAEPGYQAGLGIAPFGERVVIVGRRGSGSGAVWVGPAPGARVPGGNPVG